MILAGFPRNCTSYEQYINRIQDGINQDLSLLAYPDLTIEIGDAVWDVLMDISRQLLTNLSLLWMNGILVFHADFITEKAKSIFFSEKSVKRSGLC